MSEFEKHRQTGRTTSMLFKALIMSKKQKIFVVFRSKIATQEFSNLYKHSNLIFISFKGNLFKEILNKYGRDNIPCNYLIDHEVLEILYKDILRKLCKGI